MFYILPLASCQPVRWGGTSALTLLTLLIPSVSPRLPSCESVLWWCNQVYRALQEFVENTWILTNFAMLVYSSNCNNEKFNHESRSPFREKFSAKFSHTDFESTSVIYVLCNHISRQKIAKEIYNQFNFWHIECFITEVLFWREPPVVLLRLPCELWVHSMQSQALSTLNARSIE